MHKKCAGCPFVLQLLAAKRCRSGNLWLLLEFAAKGSLTSLLTERQQQAHSPASSAITTTAPNWSIVHEAVAQMVVAAALPVAAIAPSSRSLSAVAAIAFKGGLPEAAARFYAACLVMALRWLHSRRILHRDIKPCNLLLFPDGYLKLADLGCCCQLPPGGTAAAQTRTGTAAYMAPEVATGATPYSYPVDMWSLGVTVWQMVAGVLPPWTQEQPQQEVNQQPEEWPTTQHLEERQRQPPLQRPAQALNFPDHFSEDLRVLLSGLLCHDSQTRFGIPQVQAAAWFQGFDWQGLQDKTLTPPLLDG
eukprot:GHRR01034462.1.p1 GENE.GHRR01034462.1~~GHRR01034462.1.p1  ORF type:complete len:305 (+),score=144.00 GHRR01034462.1:237-1151(+)